MMRMQTAQVTGAAGVASGQHSAKLSPGPRPREQPGGLDTVLPRRTSDRPRPETLSRPAPSLPSRQRWTDWQTSG